MPLEIPAVKLGVSYITVLGLLHGLERDHLISHYRDRRHGASLIWKLISAGERQLSNWRRERV